MHRPHAIVSNVFSNGLLENDHILVKLGIDEHFKKIAGLLYSPVA